MQETEDIMSYAVPLLFHEKSYTQRIRDHSLYPLLVTVEAVCVYSCRQPKYVRAISSSCSKASSTVSFRHLTPPDDSLCSGTCVLLLIKAFLLYVLCGYYLNIFQVTCQWLIGATGFEPATSRPPAVRATKLRHTPRTVDIVPNVIIKINSFFKKTN